MCLKGTLRSYGRDACDRWYFTFHGTEWTKPATIEGLVYVGSTNVEPHRHTHIEGYCNQVPEGHMRVGFRVGKCEIYNLANLLPADDPCLVL